MRTVGDSIMVLTGRIITYLTFNFHIELIGRPIPMGSPLPFIFIVTISGHTTLFCTLACGADSDFILKLVFQRY